MRDYLVGVVGTPLVMWAVFLGCGLAVERVLRVRLGNALLLVLGMCVAFVLIMPGYALGAGDTLAVALILVVAVPGLLFASGGIRARVNPGWAGAAGLAAYVVYLLPVIAHGHWTWSGYDFVNDSAFELLLANHVKSAGTVLGSLPESSQRQFLAQYLGAGYPLGTQSLLGTFSGLISMRVEVLYQPYISALAAMGGVALATVAERWLRAWRAALVGFTAVCANLTYQYALQGGIKEIGLVATVCALVALACVAISLARPYAGGVLVAIAAAAALAAYNAVSVPYIGALVLFIGVALISGRRRPRPGWILPIATAVALTALLSIPTLTTFHTFFNVASAGQGSSGEGAVQFGQLLRKLPVSQLSGVWLSGEYRLPVIAGWRGTITTLATVVMLALLIVALLWSLRRREAGVLLLLGMMGLVMLIVFPRTSPYAQGKLLAIASPAVVFVALSVLAAARGRLSPPALGLGAVLALAVFASDMFAYGHGRVAPTERIEAIREAGDHYAGKGLVLWNEFEEYAKYFARSAQISVPFEAVTPQQVELRSPTYFYGHYFDLDEETLSFVEGYPYIVTRRSPAASRPPANFHLTYENGYYLGWTRAPAPVVLEHLPEQQLYSPSGSVTCAALAPIVSHAPAGTELIVARAPELVSFSPQSDLRRTAGWVVDPARAGAVLTETAGQAEGVIDVRAAGRYAVWVQGDFPRKAYVKVDGRTVGWVAGSNTPGQWLQAASLRLGAGAHSLRISEIGGHHHLGPGEWPSGDPGSIGAVGLQREEAETLTTVPLAGYRSLCGTEADWVELVRP